MYIVDGIAYAGEQQPDIEVVGVRPLSDYRLQLRFNTGEIKIFDFSELINEPAFKPLADEKIFRDVYIDYGVPSWLDGDIDISPEAVYNNGVSISEYAQAMSSR